MSKKYVVLRDRERSSMVSVWDELLCLGFGTVKLYKLYLGAYEILGDKSEYYDAEADEYVLPSDIQGKAVRGIKDDAIIGYEVENMSDESGDEFEFDEPTECEGWLTEARWLDDRLLADLHTAVTTIGEPESGVDRPVVTASTF